MPAEIVAVGGTFGTTGHTEWVEGKIQQTDFTSVFTPNFQVSFSNANEVHDINFVSKLENLTAAVPTYAAVIARSYHVGCVRAALMDGAVQSITNSIDGNVCRGLTAKSGGELASTPR